MNLNHGGKLTKICQNSLTEVMIVIPGGGYVQLTENEREAVAIKFSEFGYTTYVLAYSVISSGYNRIDEMFEDVHQAIQSIKKEGISVILCGFSAGANLALNYGNRYEDVDVIISSYGAIHWPKFVESLNVDTGFESINQKLQSLKNEGLYSLFGTTDVEKDDLEKLNALNTIHKKTPPTFLWHCKDDHLVSYTHSLDYFQKLIKNNIPCELHIFHDGEHGIGLGENTSAQIWPTLANAFIQSNIKNLS